MHEEDKTGLVAIGELLPVSNEYPDEYPETPIKLKKIEGNRTRVAIYEGDHLPGTGTCGLAFRWTDTLSRWKNLRSVLLALYKHKLKTMGYGEEVQNGAVVELEADMDTIEEEMKK